MTLMWQGFQTCHQDHKRRRMSMLKLHREALAAAGPTTRAVAARRNRRAEEGHLAVSDASESPTGSNSDEESVTEGEDEDEEDEGEFDDGEDDLELEDMPMPP